VLHVCGKLFAPLNLDVQPRRFDDPTGEYVRAGTLKVSDLFKCLARLRGSEVVGRPSQSAHSKGSTLPRSRS
jgi:hypothetical protein